MAPLLAWTASEVDKRSAAIASPDRHNGHPGTGDSDDNGNDDDNSDSDNEDIDDNDGITITTVGGNLKISTRAHHLYLQRCSPQDMHHSMHSMSYFVWHKLVRVEKVVGGGPKCSGAKVPTDTAGAADLSSDDTEGIGDIGDATIPAAGPHHNKGRPSTNRFPFVGDVKTGKQQVR